MCRVISKFKSHSKTQSHQNTSHHLGCMKKRFLKIFMQTIHHQIHIDSRPIKSDPKSALKSDWFEHMSPTTCGDKKAPQRPIGVHWSVSIFYMTTCLLPHVVWCKKTRGDARCGGCAASTEIGKGAVGSRRQHRDTFFGRFSRLCTKSSHWVQKHLPNFGQTKTGHSFPVAWFQGG